jgi:hypothetical protein
MLSANYKPQLLSAIRANGMLALTERNVKSDGIHVTLSKVEEQTTQTLMFNMTDELRFGS